MKKIALSQGKYALVDDSDFEWLSQWKWFVRKSKEKFYVTRKARGKNIRPREILMHRVINATPAGLLTDHKDRNTLNNCRDNLRTATVTENNRNCGPQKNNKSGFKGVFWDSTKNKWHVAIKVDRKRIFIGYFTDKESAAREYDIAAKKYHGEFAYLNFRKI